MLGDAALPIRASVRGACEILGLDPLHIANEGQFLAVVAPDLAEAALIGELRDDPAGTVLARTAYGGSRVLDRLVGDPLPRIC